jgi:hypothetical protein
MMTSELRYVLKSNGNYEWCSDQESLRELLVDLQEVADELGLDFTEALAWATPQERKAGFDPCI